MNIGLLFNELLVRPLVTVLVAIYQGLDYFNIPYALGFSIILLTILIKVILYPLTSSYLKASMKMQKLNPHLSRLKEKHKGNSARLQQETMKLYKEHGVNPAAGCLPSLVQIPIIWALYAVLQQIVAFKPAMIVSEINKLVYAIGPIKLTSPWDSNFFGIPLGQNPSQLVSAVPFILLVPFITGVLQLVQSKMIITTPKKAVVEKTKEKKEEKSGVEDFSSAFQTQSLYIFPVMIAFFSYSFPIGISLYWNTQTLFAILQQYHVQGLGGLSEWIKFIPERKDYGKK